MPEKFSDRPIRQEKVNRLKERLTAEINELLRKDIEALRRDSLLENDPFVRSFIDEAHSLYVLRDYLRDDFALMRTHAICEHQNTIVYRVSDTTIEWMLQEESLLNSILFRIMQYGGCVETVLSEEFFEYDVFGVMDRVVWDKSKKKEQQTK